MSEAQYRVGLRALETIGHVAPLDGLSCLVKAASEEFEVYVIGYQSIVDRALTAVQTYAAGQPQFDDMTVVVVKVLKS